MSGLFHNFSFPSWNCILGSKTTSKVPATANRRLYKSIFNSLINFTYVYRLRCDKTTISSLNVGVLGQWVWFKVLDPCSDEQPRPHVVCADWFWKNCSLSRAFDQPYFTGRFKISRPICLTPQTIYTFETFLHYFISNRSFVIGEWVIL